MRRLLLILMVIVFCINPISFATATPIDSCEDIETNYYILYSSNGDVLSFNMPSVYEKTRAEDGTYLKSIRLGSGSRDDVDSGYHPETQTFWNPACYYFTKSRTVSLGISFTVNSKKYNASIEVSAMASQTNATAGSFPADVNRKSKVRVYTDFDYVLYKGEVRDIYTDELYHTFNYTTLTKTGETFRVVYKDEGWS